MEVPCLAKPGVGCGGRKPGVTGLKATSGLASQCFSQTRRLTVWRWARAGAGAGASPGPLPPSLLPTLYIYCLGHRLGEGTVGQDTCPAAGPGEKMGRGKKRRWSLGLREPRGGSGGVGISVFPVSLLCLSPPVAPVSVPSPAPPPCIRRPSPGLLSPSPTVRRLGRVPFPRALTAI